MELCRKNVRTIDLTQYRANMKAIRDAVPAGAKLLAVVKADAYGHGMLHIAREAEKCGADMLAVAITEEGAALRRGGIALPVLVLGATTEASAMQGVANGLTLTVCSPEMVDWCETAAKALGKDAYVHMKIDSGMCRIGCRNEEEVTAVLAAIRRTEHVKLTGAFTHFADADGADMAFTMQQLACFDRLTALLPDDIIRHCCNSAAIHRLPGAAKDMVRAGITMYGYPPVDTDMAVKPFMTWESEVTWVKTINPGDTVSYGRTFTAQQPMQVATVAVGYGDGYHRAASGKAQVLIGGRRCNVIGRICMDQLMADVTGMDVHPGDRVVLMGEMGDERITAEDIASWAGTISYEVLLGATGRVPRVWINASDE
ncbi:MAG: alanine racemase [Clostridia bacterium]|nr:alanine racemase [Clostridia bacterium]